MDYGERMNAKGYMGKIARVDLTAGKIEIIELADDFARKYIGGSGFGAKYLYDETGPETDPLGPENLLIFATGPVTGTKAFNSDRFEVITKSPKSGMYGEANCGGKWGSRFKKCGLDALIIKGCSDKPVYLNVTDDGVEIVEANEVWGKDTFKTHKILKEKSGEKSEVACIGQSGEMMMPIASIIADGRHGRAAARSGVGAVMGSKKLKAVVVSGTQAIETADSDLITATNKSVLPTMKTDAKALTEAGSACSLDAFEEIGNLPIKNWYQGNWQPAVDKLTGYASVSKIKVKNYGCGNCPIRCGKVVRTKGGEYDGLDVAAPEYETVALFGSNCLIDDYDTLIKENEICNAYGVDTIAAGNIISFAMEAFERGALTLEQTGGMDLSFGNAESAKKLLEIVVKKEGFLGELFHTGIRDAAEKLGKNSCEYALHVKNQEMPAHDPRANFSLALNYATTNRGACHLTFSQDYEEGSVKHLGAPEQKGRFSPEKAMYTAKMQDWATMFDSLCLCKFARYGGVMIEECVKYLNGSTGWEFTPEEFIKAGERLFNLKRMYNIRHGASRKDDQLPLRMQTHRRGGGTNELPPFNIMLNEYYNCRGWNDMGIPEEEKLKELELV
jgi:aldehyde:ferredoxin oxidoreductase